MKPTQYRAWSTEENIWIDLEKEPYGINSNGELVRYYFENKQIKTEIIPAVVTQSTGVRDKFGKMIFEGDIVNFYHSMGKEMSAFHSEILWKQEWCGFYFKDNLRLNTNMKIEVIGNKFEQPELLLSVK